MPEIESFIGALGRAARHGAPLSDTLAAQARDARLSRRRAIQEDAARAGPKMQLVVALLLVPSVMLLVAAALLSALLDGGSGGFHRLLSARHSLHSVPPPRPTGVRPLVARDHDSAHSNTCPVLPERWGNVLSGGTKWGSVANS